MMLMPEEGMEPMTVLSLELHLVVEFWLVIVRKNLLYLHPVLFQLHPRIQTLLCLWFVLKKKNKRTLFDFLEEICFKLL